MGTKILPVLFEPPPNNLALSVSYANGRNQNELRELGDEVRELRSDANEVELCGWASICDETVRSFGLNICRDDQPFRGHANIIGWSGDRGERKKLCRKLAENAEAFPL